MPWICAACGFEAATDTQSTCPSCEGVKTSWTLQDGVTRDFKVAASKPEFLRGRRDTEGSLTVRLEIDPAAPASADDRFLLFSPLGDFAEQLRTVADDLTPDDDTTDLLFEGLDRGLNYTLEVDPGDEGEPYTIFEDTPFQTLVQAQAPSDPLWDPAEAVPVSSKGTLRDLAARGAAPNPARLVRVRKSNTKSGTVRVLVPFSTQQAAEHEVEAPGGEATLLFAYGRGSLDGVQFPGITVVDLFEDTPAGCVPSVELGWGKRRPREFPVEPPPGGSFYLRLDIDAEDAESRDDRFILTSPRGCFTPQIKTVDDDLTPDDAYTDLQFDGLPEDASYTLEVDPGGDQKPYRVFEDVAYSELAGISAEADESEPAAEVRA